MKKEIYGNKKIKCKYFYFKNVLDVQSTINKFLKKDIVVLDIKQTESASGLDAFWNLSITIFYLEEAT